MQEPAVIVLLVHNAESRLERLVERVFEASEQASCRLSVVIVDDGSTDETYEVACEQAVIYPQLRVFRQSRQSGLGAALERVRQVVSANRAIVYDGVSPLEPSDLASLLQEPQPADPTAPGSEEARGSRRFAAVRQLNEALERAHRPLTSFRWLPLDSTWPTSAGEGRASEPSPLGACSELLSVR